LNGGYLKFVASIVSLVVGWFITFSYLNIVELSSKLEGVSQSNFARLDETKEFRAEIKKEMGKIHSRLFEIEKRIYRGKLQD
jgi:hypothetical protein